MRARPTKRVGRMKAGSMTMPRRESFQFREKITMRVMVTVKKLEAMAMSEPVTVLWMPATSAVRRDMISPVLVLVKKRRESPCRGWERSEEGRGGGGGRTR